MGDDLMDLSPFLNTFVLNNPFNKPTVNTEGPVSPISPAVAVDDQNNQTNQKALSDSETTSKAIKDPPVRPPSAAARSSSNEDESTISNDSTEAVDGMVRSADKDRVISTPKAYIGSNSDYARRLKLSVTTDSALFLNWLQSNFETCEDSRVSLDEMKRRCTGRFQQLPLKQIQNIIKTAFPRGILVTTDRETFIYGITTKAGSKGKRKYTKRGKEKNDDGIPNESSDSSCSQVQKHTHSKKSKILMKKHEGGDSDNYRPPYHVARGRGVAKRGRPRTRSSSSRINKNSRKREACPVENFLRQCSVVVHDVESPVVIKQEEGEKVSEPVISERSPEAEINTADGVGEIKVEPMDQYEVNAHLNSKERDVKGDSEGDSVGELENQIEAVQKKYFSSQTQNHNHKADVHKPQTSTKCANCTSMAAKCRTLEKTVQELEHSLLMERMKCSTLGNTLNRVNTKLAKLEKTTEMVQQKDKFADYLKNEFEKFANHISKVQENVKVMSDLLE